MDSWFGLVSALEAHFWQPSICLKLQLLSWSLLINWVTWHSEVVMVPEERRSEAGIEWVSESAD